MIALYTQEVKTSHAEALFNKYCNLIGYKLLAIFSMMMM